MIRYALACEEGHAFESWFASSGSYDEQVARGLVTCPHCGSGLVVKRPMAPSLGRSGEPAASAETPALPVADDPQRRMRSLLRAVRQQIEANAEHVGPRFPEEARKIHYRETESRAIYGEASPSEARALVDEGIAVAPLPPAPDERN